MKKIAFALLLSAFVAAPAVAADGKNSVGINYGLDLDGVFGIQGEFDISSMVEKAPISVQVFWKRASQDSTVLGFTTTATTSALGVAGIYDLSSVFKVSNNKVQPYVGLGIRSEKEEVSVAGVTASASKSELHVTGGVKYALNPQFAADLNYNDFGGITVGVDYSF